MKIKIYVVITAMIVCMTTAVKASPIHEVANIPTLELNLSKNINSKQFAAIHFLGTESDISFSKPDKIDGNTDANNGYKKCKAAGYSVVGTDCRAKGAGWTPFLRCPNHSNYYKSCSDCTAYTLDVCPDDGANCSKCGNGKFKVDSCQIGYKLEGSTCIYGCNDYSLTACPTNAASCSNCQYDSAKKKLDSCNSGYVVSGSTCACVPATPPGYLATNTCEFGVESTKEDHCGRTYYKCKAITSCAQFVTQDLKQYTPISSQETLKNALTNNLDNMVVVNDFVLEDDVDLSGKNIFGANDITSTPLCANMATPTITVKKSIFTDNDSNFRKLNFKNYAEGYNSSSKTAMIIGGGSFSDIEFSVLDCGKAYCDGNYYKHHIAAKGGKVVNLYNIKSSGKNNFTVENASKLNIKGKVETAEGSAISMAGSEPIFNLETSGILIHGDATVVYAEGIGEGDPTKPEKSPLAYNAHINIDGSLTVAKTDNESFNIHDGILKINTPVSIGRIYGYPLKEHKAEVYINAKTTINHNNFSSIDLDGGSIYINAPLNIINTKKFTDGPYVSDHIFEAGKIYINSDFTTDNLTNLVYKVYIRSIEFGPKANVRGLGRIFISYASYDSPSTYIPISSGAKLQIGGVCKRATTNSQITVHKSTIDWKTPPSQFSGGC